MTELEGLPASEMIVRGLRDLQEGERTIDALVVAIASRRLLELGLPVLPGADLPREPELALYELLCTQSEDPFFAYQALLGRLDSFVSSLEASRKQPERTITGERMPDFAAAVRRSRSP